MKIKSVMYIFRYLRYLFKHNSNHRPTEAQYAFNNILHPDKKILVNYAAMPHTIFSSTRVGFTEQEKVVSSVRLRPLG